MMSNLSPPTELPQIPSRAATSPLATTTAAQTRDAAQQFEALLLAQLLHSARESSGWGESDLAGACATDFAEQQFAQVLAQQGGLGLAALITAGLEQDTGTRGSGGGSLR